MSQLGIEERPVLVRTMRDPIWQEGLIESTSQDAESSVAIASLQKFGEWGIFGLGADMEPHTGLPHDLTEWVCTQAELRYMAQLSEESASGVARRVFPIKETV